VAYQFTGFFAKPTITPPRRLPEGAVWRNLDTPFVGIGVRLPAFHSSTAPAGEVLELARRLGLDPATDWLFLVYTCWGGRIDSVYGLCWNGSRVIEDGRYCRVTILHVVWI